MGIFRRSRTPRPTPLEVSTGHEGDDALLALMAAQTDLTQPRHWVHYLYVEHEAAARSAAEVIAAAGWELQSVGISAAGGPDWVVVAEKHGAVTSPDAVREARTFFEAVAAREAGGDYDGWEAGL